MTLGGVTQGTDAGTYEATFTPKEGYTWDGEDTSPKTVSWTIGRAHGGRRAHAERQLDL